MSDRAAQAEQTNLFGESYRYGEQSIEAQNRQFLDKFKPKKTTDECFTPPYIYEEVMSWLGEQADLNGRQIVRPFYPGGDYTAHEYPEGCIVVDNPPFSILAQIVRHYLATGVDFFLFAPTLTLQSSSSYAKACGVVCGVPVIYDNGANVNTSFLTSLFPDLGIWIAGDLFERIERRQSLELQAERVPLPKYKYPPHVVSSATMSRIAQQGVSLKMPQREMHYIRVLDSQRPMGKAIFGSGFLISDRLAKQADEARRQADEARRQADEARRQADEARRQADEARACTWELSERELEIIQSLGDKP